jgi:hypothetical protein
MSAWRIAVKRLRSTNKRIEIVILSNGGVLDLGANIADDVSDVRSITYVLHVPKGVSLLRSISTDGPVGYQERFNFQPDSKLSGPVGVYQVELQVQTRSKHIGMTATITWTKRRRRGMPPKKQERSPNGCGGRRSAPRQSSVRRARRLNGIERLKSRRGNPPSRHMPPVKPSLPAFMPL